MYTVALPGLATADVIEIQDTLYDHARVCPLTMHPMGQCASAAFLTEMSTFNTHSPTSAAITRGVECEHMGMATIRGCGHTFAALPLLYNIMSRQFRCPICRGGSNAEVDLTRACVDLPADVWQVLCIICAETKKRYKQETADEENALIISEHAGADGTFADMDFDSIVDIVAFRAIFSVYRTGAHTQNSTTIQTPVAVIVFNLKHSRQFDSNDNEERIVFSCGMRVYACVCV